MKHLLNYTQRLSTFALLAGPLLLLSACSSESERSGDEAMAPEGDEAASGANSTDGGPGGTSGDDGGGSDPWGTSGGADSGSASGGGADSSGGGDTGFDPEDPDAEPEPDAESESETGEGDACDEETPIALYLSPDDSNSMSSPVQIRDAILRGFQNLSQVSIRTYEFFNYYDFDYPAATPGSVLVTPSLRRNEDDPEGRYTLQIGVSSEDVALEQRDPVHLTLVLDTSGSMAGEPMEMLLESCRAMLSALRAGDRVSMVTWADQQTPILAGYEVSGADDTFVLGKIDELSAGGGTDLNGGLIAGYELANQAFSEGMINRVVLISDGGANLGVTSADLIGENAIEGGADGVYLVGVGVGEPQSYNDDLMDQVTDAGKGASIFVTTAEEARKVFEDDFASTFLVAARDVQIRLDLPPGFEIVSFSGEEFSADPAEVEAQHLAPNDAMVFFQDIETCAPELVDGESEITVTATYQDAITFETREETLTVSFGELLAEEDPRLLKGEAIFEYAESLKVLKSWNSTEELTRAITAVESASVMLPEDPDLSEIREVLATFE
jgi:Ca-activated chloride channel family protein